MDTLYRTFNVLWDIAELLTVYNLLIVHVCNSLSPLSLSSLSSLSLVDNRTVSPPEVGEGIVKF